MKNFKTFLLLSLSLVFMTFLVSCDGADTEMEETREEMNEGYVVEKTELRDNIVDRQREIDSRIDQLQTDLETATAEEKQEIQNNIDQLQQWRANLDTDLQRLDEATEANWEEFKTDVDQTLDDIGRGIQNLGQEAGEEIENPQYE